ncbi:MAG: hypothetical protein ACE5D7_04650, partial [Fidelibacterota bacterium]
MLSIFYIFMSFLFFYGCSNTTLQNTVNPEDSMVFPMPPADPRIQFLTSISSSSDVEEFKKIDEFLFGKSLLELERTIDKPFGAFIANNKIYVCDTKLEGLEIIDLENRKFEEFRPAGRGTLRKPINAAIDNSGNLYVADTGREQIVVFSPELKYIKSIDSGSLKPIDLAISGDSLLIADLKDQNVEIWSISQNKLLSEFPPDNINLPDSIRVFAPYSVDLDINKNIYITDFGQFRVQKFDRTGNFIRSFGGVGRSIGKFARPKGIAIDRKSRLYVVDAAYENVQIFNENGELLLIF